jgi:hypothetical protein
MPGFGHVGIPHHQLLNEEEDAAGRSDGSWVDGPDEGGFLASRARRDSTRLSVMEWLRGKSARVVTPVSPDVRVFGDRP